MRQKIETHPPRPPTAAPAAPVTSVAPQGPVQKPEPNPDPGKLQILHLEDCRFDQELIARLLAREGLACEVSPVKNRIEFETALRQKKFDVILSDFSMPGYDGLSALSTARQTQPAAAFLFVSGTIGEERAVQSLKAGAVDYVLKDRLGRLAPAVRRALKDLEEQTERRRLEEQLRQSQKLEAIGQLSAGVAHDFNNLLAIMRSHVDLVLMREENLAAESHECLQRVLLASGRAATLIKQLLTFARLEPMQPRPTNIVQLLEDLTRMLCGTLGPGISFECVCAPNLPLVNADPGMVEQVLMNLVVNGRDSMPNGGALSISTERVFFERGFTPQCPEARPGHFVRLSVCDTGTGIPPEHLPRIFEPFFTTKDVGKGTGLGLATVYGIVQQHRGWIEVSSAVGEGSAFQVYLPE
jgi:signal transduction histidine kinase